MQGRQNLAAQGSLQHLEGDHGGRKFSSTGSGAELTTGAGVEKGSSTDQYSCRSIHVQWAPKILYSVAKQKTGCNNYNAPPENSGEL